MSVAYYTNFSIFVVAGPVSEMLCLFSAENRGDFALLVLPLLLPATVYWSEGKSAIY